MQPDELNTTGLPDPLLLHGVQSANVAVESNSELCATVWKYILTAANMFNIGARPPYTLSSMGKQAIPETVSTFWRFTKSVGLGASQPKHGSGNHLKHESSEQ